MIILNQTQASAGATTWAVIDRPFRFKHKLFDAPCDQLQRLGAIKDQTITTCKHCNRFKEKEETTSIRSYALRSRKQQEG